MPRNIGTNLYYIPPGTEGFPDTTIESEKYNTYIHDVETDLNKPRPIVAGGTGANDADEALSNLGAEKSSQKVVNYDTHIFKPGSLYSDSAATASPIAGHAFVGWVISSDVPAEPPVNQNVVVFARDQGDARSPRTYVREKKAGVWGPWDIDGGGIASPTPPLSPPDGALWWDNISGQLYVYYTDVDSSAWVIASPVPDPAQFLLKAGDKMEGTLGLMADPVAPLDAVSKQYLDARMAAAPPSVPAGSVMFFHLTAAPTGWVKRTDINDYALRVVNGTITAGGVYPFSTIFSQTVTQGHALNATEQANMNVVGSFSGTATINSHTLIATGDGSAGWTYHTTTSIPFSGSSPSGPATGSISGTAQGNGATGNYHTHPIPLQVQYIDTIMATKS